VNQSIQDQLLARIERLEQQNRRLKRGALVCLLAVASMALLVFASNKLLAQTQAPRKPAAKPSTSAKAPATPSAPAPVVLPENIEAKSFILKDAAGMARAVLAMGGTGPSLKLMDTAGTALVTLALNDAAPGGPYLLLSDPQHKAALSMSVLGGAGSQLTLTGERPDIQAHLGVAPDGTSLVLSDADGFSANIGSGIQPAKNGQIKKTQAASIALFNKDRRLLYSAP
jgi:hypothetical protein